MILKITADLEWGEIFAGKIDFPMACKLEIAEGYYLIFADLNWEEAQGDGFDLFALLNDAFPVRLPTGFLVVERAGFFTFSATESGDHNAKVIHVFPDAPLPDIVKERAEPVHDTTSFWTSININTFSLFGTLLQVGYEGENNISLMGVFESGELAGKAISTTTYLVRFPRILLLRIFDFTDLTLEYRFDRAAQYRIQGTLCLQLFGEKYCFKGHVTSTETTLKACIMAVNPDDQVEPFFGKMLGVTFEDLIFALSFTYATDEQNAGNGQYRVQGTVSYAGFRLLGQMYLKDTDVILASLVVDQDLNIGDVFSQSIPFAAWPTSFINIVFHDGSRLYYAAPEAEHTTLTEVAFTCAIQAGSDEMEPTDETLDEIRYADGFNIYARFTITVITEINLAGTIQINDEGVKAEIQLTNKIDVFVLQIIEPCAEGDPDTPRKGPVFCFDSAQSSMGFKCGLTFFQKDFGLSTEIQGQKGPKGDLALSGILRSNNPFFPVLPKAPIELHFTYDSANGFQVSNWPTFDFISDVIDFCEEVKEVANKTGKGCGKLADFIFKDLLETDYKISPTFDTVDDQLYFVLNGKVEMSIRNEPFLVLEFPDAMRIELPNDMSMDAIPEAIERALKSAATSFVNALLNNAEAIAMFLVIMAGKEAAEYAMKLVCKNLVNQSVTKAVKAGMEALEAAKDLGSFALAIGAVAVTIASAVAKSCFIASTKVLLADGSETDIENIQVGDVLLGQDGRQNRVIGLDHPQLGRRLLYALNQGAHFVTAEHPFMTLKGWKAIDPAATLLENPNFHVEPLSVGDVLVTASGAQVLIAQISSRSAAMDTQLFNFLLEGNHTYYANGFLVHNKGGGGGGKDENPTAPEGLKLIYQSPDVRASWQSATSAQGYDYAFSKPGGSGKTEHVKFTTTAVDLPIDENDPAGTYRFQVQSTKDTFSSKATNATIERLETPELQGQLLAGSVREMDPVLELQWQLIEGATAYRFTMDTQEQTLEGKVHQKRITFSDDDIWGTFSFGITAMSDGSAIDSVTSLPYDWHRLRKPSGLKAQVVGGLLQIEWLGTDGNVNFLVSVRVPETAQTEYFKVEGSNQLTLDVSQDILHSVESETESLLLSVRSLASEAPELAPVAQQIPSIWSDAIEVDLSLTPLEIAEQCFAAGLSGTACADAIKQQFPELPANEMAVAMKAGGYALEETAQGLVAAYPETPPAELIQILMDVYSLGPITAVQIAQLCFHFQLSGADCGELILALLPETRPEDMAVAMKAGGYELAETAQGLRAAYAETPPSELIQALIFAYGLPQISPAQIAVLCFNSGVSGETCASLIIHFYPQILLTDMAIAMKNGGYTSGETAAGLAKAYPSSTKMERIHALLEAYGIPLEFAESVAAWCFQTGLSGAECGPVLINFFPDLTHEALAVAMAKGGYPETETGWGLKKAFPSITGSEVVRALNKAYPNSSELAKECYLEGKSGEECAATLIQQDPGLTMGDMAIAMKDAGYEASETAQGLREAYPKASSTEVSRALISAYGTS